MRSVGRPGERDERPRGRRRRGRRLQRDAHRRAVDPALQRPWAAGGRTRGRRAVACARTCSRTREGQQDRRTGAEEGQPDRYGQVRRVPTPCARTVTGAPGHETWSRSSTMSVVVRARPRRRPGTVASNQGRSAWRGELLPRGRNRARAPGRPASLVITSVTAFRGRPRRGRCRHRPGPGTVTSMRWVPADDVPGSAGDDEPPCRWTSRTRCDAESTCSRHTR